MKQYAMMLVACVMLVLVYVFQQVSFAGILNGVLPGNLSIQNPNTVFIINRTLRMIINDTACMMLIWGLFKEIKYVKVAFLVFCVELLLILPLYFIVKLMLEGPSELSSPLLSQIHRIIVNPLLMVILIIGFYYQKVITGIRA